MTTTPIDLSYPEEVVREVRIRVSACRLVLTPGNDTRWLTGTYHDPSSRIPLEVETHDGVAVVRQTARLGDWVGVLSGTPRLELALGTAHPFSLHLEVGAAGVDADVTGVPLTRVGLRTGAGRSQLRFGARNPVEMEALTVNVGAGATDVSGLAYARAAEVLVNGGAADCSLRFDGGPLERSTAVRVSTGMAAVGIEVPSSLATEVRAESTLGRVDLPAWWQHDRGVYRNDAAQASVAPAEGNGDGGSSRPRVTMYANVALGSFRVHERPASGDARV